MKVGVLNYKIAGNIYSIKKALKEVGANNIVELECENDFKNIDKLVIPGVGSFKDAMSEIEPIREILIENIKTKPTLGICLGMQILSKVGFEFGKTDGLGVIEAEVKPIECEGHIPHMGFNSIEIVKNSPLFKNIDKNSQFYFMHSYEVVNYTDILSLTTYFNHKFVSSIQKDNIFGVQFHPEKSREAGLKIFENFLNL